MVMTKPTVLPPSATLDTVTASTSQWASVFSSLRNPLALQQLLRDKPQKRRKVYFEFCWGDRAQILEEMAQAGFDMKTVRREKEITVATPQMDQGFSCLVTGSAWAILRFIYKNSKVMLASVDLSEYSWLSTTRS